MSLLGKMQFKVIPLKKSARYNFFKFCQYIDYHEGIQKT